MQPLKHLGLIALAASLLMGCPSDPGRTPDGKTNNMSPTPDMTPTNNVTPPDGPIIAPSQRPRVQFKGQKRWGTDLSRSLDLPRTQLCKELSEYDCLDRVHTIALGGVEPYNLGIDEPVPVAPVTAPIAADRVALAACDTRAQQDFMDLPNAVIFKEMPARGNPDEAGLQAMSKRLYERLLQREATDEEVGHLVAFWAEVEAEKPENPAREWATLTCFAVATSLESLFY